MVTGQSGGQGGGASAAAGSQGNNTAITDWRSALPEALRGEKAFESIKGKDLNEALPELSKQFLHAQRMVGADKVVLPNDKSTPEEIKAFRTKLGVPENPDDYKDFKLPEGLTADKLDKERLTLWQKEMHEAGIPKSQAERLISKFLSEEHGHGQAQLQAQAKQIENWELQVKQEFGTKLDEKLNFSRWAVKEFGDPELVAVLDSTGLGSHPSVVKLLAKIGEQLADDKQRGFNSGGPRGGNLTPESAQAALSAFNRDEAKQAALFKADHPQHEIVVKERQALFEAAFPKATK
jgi:hypothetical protein